MLKMEVRGTRSKGRGVFALVKFAPGEVIEAVPVILIPAREWPHIEPTVLALYIYNFGPTAEQEHAAIALGYGSLYNHSYRPNAKYIKDWDRQTYLFCSGARHCRRRGNYGQLQRTARRPET